MSAKSFRSPSVARGRNRPRFHDESPRSAALPEDLAAEAEPAEEKEEVAEEEEEEEEEKAPSAAEWAVKVRRVGMLKSGLGTRNSLLNLASLHVSSLVYSSRHFDDSFSLRGAFHRRPGSLPPCPGPSSTRRFLWRRTSYKSIMLLLRRRSSSM